MSQMQEDSREAARTRPKRGERAINAPLIVLLLIASFVALHGFRGLLSRENETLFVLLFAFTPARYAPPLELLGVAFPGGIAAQVWTFVTHMFLHGSWLHLAVNSFWMLAFGSVVARRFGALRFLMLTLVCAAAGAAASLALHWGQFTILVGASGAISGQMAGAVRLMFSRDRPGLRFNTAGAGRALSLGETFRNAQALVFLGVWLGINILFAASGLSVPGETSRIAWEAHLGGFVCGLLLFGLLDPAKKD